MHNSIFNNTGTVSRDKIFAKVVVSGKTYRVDRTLKAGDTFDLPE